MNGNQSILYALLGNECSIRGYRLFDATFHKCMNLYSRKYIYILAGSFI